MLKVFPVELAHSVTGRVIAPGVVGIPGLTVKAMLLAGLLPQMLFATTDNVPAVTPAAKSIVMLFPLPFIMAPVPE